MLCKHGYLQENLKQVRLNEYNNSLQLRPTRNFNVPSNLNLDESETILPSKIGNQGMVLDERLTLINHIAAVKKQNYCGLRYKAEISKFIDGESDWKLVLCLILTQ